MMSSYPSFNQIFCDKNITNLMVDFRMVIKINNKIIAFETQGDPNTDLFKRLEDVMSYNPDVLICTCRTRGQTVHDIESIATNFNQDVIWTSTCHTNNNSFPHAQVNQIKAGHLMDLLIRLNLI
jgi:hypothetical protein